MSEWDETSRRWVHEDVPLPPVPEVTYREDLTERWRCTIHDREATYVRSFNNGRQPERCCNPRLGGIMLPCRCEKEQ